MGRTVIISYPIKLKIKNMPLQLKNEPPYYTTATATPVIEKTIVPILSSGGSVNNDTNITIPANTLKNNGDVMVVEILIKTIGADAKTCDLTLGTSSTLLGSGALTTAGDYKQLVKIIKVTDTSYIVRGETWRTLSFQGLTQDLKTDVDFRIQNTLRFRINSVNASSIETKYLAVVVSQY